MRYLLATSVVFLLFVAGGQAGDEGVVGNWKLSIFEDRKQSTYWLVSLEAKGGKLTGAVEPLGKVQPSSMMDVKVSDDVLNFVFKVEKIGVFQFEGKLPRAGGKKIFGSLARGRMMIPAVLEATKAKNNFQYDQDMLLRNPNDPRVFDVVVSLIEQAKENKVPAKEVQEWIDTGTRAAENYGPRWQNDFAVQMTDVLLSQGDYASLAVLTARNAEKLPAAKIPAESRLRLLTSFVNAVKQAGQKDQIKDIEARIPALEIKGYQENEASEQEYQVAKFPGRKTKSNRAVLVELFTGAQCPPCVGADLAFDALQRAFGPKEVVLLQYHLHIPRADALTNADNEARAAYYGEDIVSGTPIVLFSGKFTPLDGGSREDLDDVFQSYKKLIEPLLETPATCQLQASATRKGDKVFIKAAVTDLDKPGNKIKLRVALAENWVRYKSKNGLSYYHQVVRAFPTGPGGVALTKKDDEMNLVVDLNELRGRLSKYLDNTAKEVPFPDEQRPMRFRDLNVVAFVQDDNTREVVQAVQAPVRDE